MSRRAIGSLTPAKDPFRKYDEKLRHTLLLMSDHYSEAIKDLILRCYQDKKLASIYNAKRQDYWQQTHGASIKSFGKAKRRKIIEFPNPYVADFVHTVLGKLYGDNWLSDSRALNHELVRPWWVVDRL